MGIATFAGPFFEDSPLLDVEAVRVYALSKHRSAWHGTRSNKYVKSAVLFETLDLCMRAADEMRVQGTYFHHRTSAGSEDVDNADLVRADQLVGG